MADIVRMSQEQLEGLIEQRLRSIHDNPTGAVQPGQPLNTRGNDDDGEERSIGTAESQSGFASRGPSMFGPRRAQITRQQAGHVMDFFRAVHNGDIQGARRANTRLGTVERLQQVGVAADGGVTVPEQFVAEVLVELPRLTPFADSRFVRIVPMSKETLRWTKVLTKPSQPALVPEGTQYGKSGATFGPIELVARKIGQIIPFTEEIIESNEIGMVSLLAELVAEQLAYKKNSLITSGTGVSQPEGVLTNSNIASSAFVSTSDSTRADSVITAFHALKSQYRSDTIWMFHDTRIALLRKLKDGQGRYIWVDGFADRPATLLGRPVFENPDLPINGGAGTDEGTGLFGNFKRGYVVGAKKGLEVERNSSGTDWEKDIVNFKFRERWDGRVNDESAFVKVTGMK